MKNKVLLAVVMLTIAGCTSVPSADREQRASSSSVNKVSSSKLSLRSSVSTSRMFSSAQNSPAESWQEIFRKDPRTDLESIEQTEENMKGQVVNTLPASMRVSYENPDAGISVDVPWNSSWGTNSYKIAPFDSFEVEGDTVVSYGPAENAFEGAGWYISRFSHFVITKPRTADAALKEAQANDWTPEPAIQTIGTHTVVRTVTNGFCDNVSLEVIGTKSNVLVSGACSTDSRALEEIVKRMKLSQ